MRSIVLACLLMAWGTAASWAQSAPAPTASPARPAPATSAGAPAAPTGKPAASPPAAPATRSTYPGIPATPAGQQLAWVLNTVVVRHGKIDQAELEAHFHTSFFTQVPQAQALKTLHQMGLRIPDVSVHAVEGDDNNIAAHGEVNGEKLRFSLAVDPPSKKIIGLRVQRDVDAGPRPQSFDEALRLVAALAPRAQLLVAELDHGTCKPVQELAANDELAIGSTFKLYVLLALADRVLAGKAAWSDELAVRDSWKSLPSGTTQNEPPGTKHPLATFAERMISISDNTAADHLLYTLGRNAVEAAVRETGHARPALDTPFLSTRELFVFKLATPVAEVERYLKLPEARRRDYLDKTLATRDANDGLGVPWQGARRIDALEWFASSMDLCRAMATLWQRAQDPRAAKLLDILAKNPGMVIDKKRWPYVGYKGGSEPGVLNVTYLLRRDDGKWFVVTLGFNAVEGGQVEEAKILNVAGGMIDLLGAH